MTENNRLNKGLNEGGDKMTNKESKRRGPYDRYNRVCGVKYEAGLVNRMEKYHSPKETKIIKVEEKKEIVFEGWMKYFDVALTDASMILYLNKGLENILTEEEVFGKKGPMYITLVSFKIDYKNHDLSRKALKKLEKNLDKLFVVEERIKASVVSESIEFLKSIVNNWEFSSDTGKHEVIHVDYIVYVLDKFLRRNNSAQGGR